MKIAPDCVDKCCICRNSGNCLAGNGDDDFIPATKEQIEERLKDDRYSAYQDKLRNFIESLYH